MIKKYSLNICSFIIFFIIFNFFYKFFMQFKQRLFAFIFCICWFWFRFRSSSAAFLLASKIIEPQSSTNLIASFLSLKSLLVIVKVFFIFQIYFQFLFLFRYLLNSSCLCRAYLIYISRFLMLSRKTRGSFNSLKLVSVLLLLLLLNFKSS